MNVQIRKLRQSLSPIEFRELIEMFTQGKLARFELSITNMNLIRQEIQTQGAHIAISTRAFRLILDEHSDTWSSSLSYCLADDPEAMCFAYIHPDKEVCETAKAFDEADDDRNLGRLLGYPECCIESYIDWQKDNEDIDPITTITNANPYSGYVSVFNFPNPFSRYFGGGLISHFPCSLNCAHTIYLAQTSCKTLRRHAPELEEKLLVLENSLVIFEKGNGICVWPEYTIDGKTIHLNPSRLHAQGYLKSVFSNAISIELFPSAISIKYQNDLLYKHEIVDCFLGAFQFKPVETRG